MKTPTIHLNGDTQQTLVDNAKAALEVFDDLRGKLQKCAPISRNFFPQGGSAVAEALTEFADLMARLDEMEEEVETYANACFHGGHQQQTPATGIGNRNMNAITRMSKASLARRGE